MTTTYDYEIIINSEPQNSAKYFHYHPLVSRPKQGLKELQKAKYEVEIWLEKDSARILIDKKPSFHPYETILNGSETILSSALRKLKMLHLFYYGQILEFKHLHISCHTSLSKKERYSESILYDANNHEPLYSLIGTQKLQPVFSAEWRSPEFIDNFLNTRLLITERRWAAIAAYACAKSKCFESERLLYNWMAFNALYGYTGKLANEILAEKQPISKLGNHKSKDPNDRESIEFFYWMETKSYCGIDEKTRNQMGDDISKKWIQPDTNVEVFLSELSDSKSPFCTEFKKEYPNIAPFSFMLFQFSYYMRCNLFHANKTIPLLSYENSSYLKCLAISNKLLEDYLEQHLPEIFDDVVFKKHLQGVIIPVSKP